VNLPGYSSPVVVERAEILARFRLPFTRFTPRTRILLERGIVLSFMQISMSERENYVREVPSINQRFLLHLGDQLSRATHRLNSAIQFISRVSRGHVKTSVTSRWKIEDAPRFSFRWTYIIRINIDVHIYWFQKTSSTSVNCDYLISLWLVLVLTESKYKLIIKRISMRSLSDFIFCILTFNINDNIPIFYYIRRVSYFMSWVNFHDFYKYTKIIKWYIRTFFMKIYSLLLTILILIIV